MDNTAFTKNPCSEILLETQNQLNDTSLAQFKRLSVPLVRRIYPQLIANKIVSVQPLLGPSGLTYYQNFRYSENAKTQWKIKKKRKKDWRNISDPWEPSVNQNQENSL